MPAQIKITKRTVDALDHRRRVREQRSIGTTISPVSACVFRASGTQGIYVVQFRANAAG